MKFLMVSLGGEGAGVLSAIQDEGNEVKLYVSEPGYRRCWDGLLPKAKSPYEDADVYIFDMSGMGDKAEELKRRGKKVFGGGKFADRLESDRRFGLEVMSASGIKTPAVYEFKGNQFREAINFVKTQKEHEKLVFKPSGCGLPTRLTYCACDNDDLLRYLVYVERSFGHEIEDFVLQEFIEGSLISTEYWCTESGFLSPPNHTVEAKKLMNDDKGPSTGCSGNLVWPCDDVCPIVQRGVARIEKLCVENNYVGPIDLNAIVHDGVVYGLEWTPRFGYDAIPTIMQLIDSEVGELFYDLANDELEEFPIINSFSGGVRLTIPPYPLEPEKIKDVEKVGPNLGIPLRGLLAKWYDHYYLYEVMKGEDGTLEHSDGTGVIFVASAAADDPEASFEIPYKMLDDAKIPDKQYRTDLNKVLPKMYSEIEEVENAA